MKRKWTRLLVAASLSSAMASGASATVMIKQDLADLLEQSELVFRGELAAARVEHADDGMPWTLYTFANVETVVGDFDGDEFSLRCAGGIADGLATFISGTPQYELGDDVLVFYDENDQACQVTAWIQGSFRVVQNDAGEEVVMTEGGNPIVGMGADDFMLGERPDWWQRNKPSGVTMAKSRLPQKGGGAVAGPGLMPADPPVTPGAERARPASWSNVKAELQAFARANVRKAWRRPTGAGNAVGTYRATPVTGAMP